MVPLAVQDKITDAQTGEKLCEPYEYLVFKQGDKYHVMGMYQNSKLGQVCRELNIPSLIFRDGIHSVILKSLNKGYIELYRECLACACLSTILIQLYPDKSSNLWDGYVQFFNPVTESLETLYDGKVLAFDFQNFSVYS